jgi:hypothetical protein
MRRPKRERASRRKLFFAAAPKHGYAGSALAAAVQFAPRDDRAIELLDELEGRTGAHPFEVSEPSGARTYDLDAARMSMDGLDETLDRIDSDWRKHLSHTP